MEAAPLRIGEGRTTLPLVVNATPDFSSFVQRREHLAQEARSARAVYAYGVDLRRTAWLDHSGVGEALMRAVDRRWSKLLEQLASDTFQPEDQSPPTHILQQLVRLTDLLRCPRPAVRLLRGDVDPRDWPVATPFGTTQGGAHLLVLDVNRLEALSPSELTFALTTALAHLQCDHGPILTAHLLAHRARRGLGLVRHILAPWTKVAVFSADRAALLVIGELAPACEALATVGAPDAPWWPPMPPIGLRVRALEDFDKSRVMARIRLLHESNQAGESEASPDAKATPPTGGDAAPVEPSADPVSDAERQADRLVEAAEAAEVAGERESEQRMIEEQLRKAWSLARCDQRLTRRLGLL